MSNSIIQYLQEHQNRFLEELFDFLRIPSISTIATHKPAIEKAALFVEDKLKKAGADKAYLIQTKGNPLVYAEKIIDRSLPTVLVYGHYDVQPADPLELWETPPFEPTLREGKIYARGASDDKGQIYMHIKVLEAMHATQTFPCNLKFLIEGEEEVGSLHIEEFLKEKENQSLVAADVVLVSDTTVIAMDTPSMVTSLRGISDFQLDVSGPKLDLHSGVYGGAVANPAEVICSILAQLKDSNGRISVPHFYDDVIEYSPEERRKINEQPFDIEKYKQEIGIQEVFGEKGYTTLERVGIRPALEVNGVYGGYTQEGIKTVLPAKAYAKISIRTVPNQDGNKIAKQIEEYIQQIAPKGVQVSFRSLSGLQSKAFTAALNSKGIKAATKAFEKIWGKKPHFMREGASIPILATFQKELKTDVVNLGFGLDSDKIHSPNEHFGVDNFAIGMKTIAAFYEFFGKGE